MNAPKISNRRSSTRRTVRMLCEAVRERGFTRLGHVALDLSSTGMLLRTSEPVLTGESVFVSFFEPMQARWFDLEATVARVIHGRRAGDQERAVALSFSALAEADRLALEEGLRARVPRLPRERGQA